MKEIVAQIRGELKKKGNAAARESGRSFFKEKVKLYGVKTAEVNRIARDFFKSIRDKEKDAIFALGEELMRSGYMEESFVAGRWAYYLRGRYEPRDFDIFQRWVERYVGNWASCDTLCNHAFGDFLEQYPEYARRLFEWAVSDNRWMRRAAAVSLIIPAKKGGFLMEIFAIAGILLKDGDDLVQKGYGWLLKAASQAHRDEVFRFVMDHRAAMPRTALRYAVEKMPPDMRKQAMARGTAAS